MAEYIVDFEGCIEEYHIEVHAPEWAKERIIRCRDCKHAKVLGKFLPNGFPFPYCKRTELMITPDGFCAWGKPREVER